MGYSNKKIQTRSRRGLGGISLLVILAPSFLLGNSTDKTNFQFSPAQNSTKLSCSIFYYYRGRYGCKNPGGPLILIFARGFCLKVYFSRG